MNASLTAAATFDSTHDDPSESTHTHGHTFAVTATELGDLAGLCPTLQADLLAVTRPLHLHTLQDMLYGGSQTLDGIAAWIMERLLMEHPRVTSVSVSAGERSATVTREIR